MRNIALSRGSIQRPGLALLAGIAVGGLLRQVFSSRARRDPQDCYRAAVLHMRDAVMVTAAEPIERPGPRIVYVNPAFTAMTGYGLDEVCQQSPRLLQGPRTDRTQLEKIHAALKAQQPVRAELINYRKDGSEFMAELDIVPVRNAAGHVTQWVSVQRDISERRRIEAALGDSEQRYRELIKALPIAVYTTDVAGRITFYNAAACALWGCVPERENQRWCGSFRMYRPDGTPLRHEDCPMAQSLRENRPLYGEEILVEQPTGHRLAVLAYPIPLRNTIGVLTGAANVLVDVTNHRNLEKALRMADQRKDEFLAMLAHELRNPLAPILNAEHVLRRLAPQDPKLLWAQQAIDRQISHLARLIDDLLDVSRITRGKITLSKRRVAFDSLIGHTVETCQPLLEAKQQSLIVASPVPDARLDADEIRLVQVLTNLIGNASKYSEPGKRIWLSAEVWNSNAVLRVRDEGVGISAEFMPSIYELFSQAEQGLDRAQGGLGIGLALAQSLVRMHGGRIEARSEGVGQGSEFTVWLPLEPSGSDAPEPDGGGIPSRLTATQSDR